MNGAAKNVIHYYHILSWHNQFGAFFLEGGGPITFTAINVECI